MISTYGAQKNVSEDGRTKEEGLKECNKSLNEIIAEGIIPTRIMFLKRKLDSTKTEAKRRRANAAFYHGDLDKFPDDGMPQGKGLCSIIVWVFLLGLFFALMF